jgi:hypothetical protein
LGAIEDIGLNWKPVKNMEMDSWITGSLDTVKYGILLLALHRMDLRHHVAYPQLKFDKSVTFTLLYSQIFRCKLIIYRCKLVDPVSAVLFPG